MTIGYGHSGPPDDEDEEELLERPDIEIVMAHLYDLDREELRRIAWEALLVSDGPDRAKTANEGPIEIADYEKTSAFHVGVGIIDEPGFTILSKRGWFS